MLSALHPTVLFRSAVAGFFLWATHQTTTQTVLINATMFQAFLYWPNIINPYWTLAYELVFYGAMATMLAANQLHNIDRIALAWLAAMILFRTSILLSGRGWDLYNDWLFQSLLMPQFGHLFIAGMMLYRINTGRGTTLTCVVLGLSVLYALFGRPDWAQIGPVVYFLANGAFIAAAWAASSGRAPIFAVPWLAGIGMCSYSLYLLHLPVKLVFSHFSGQLMGYFWFPVLVIFPTALGLSLLVRIYVEQPAQSWIKSWAARARPVREAA